MSQNHSRTWILSKIIWCHVKIGCVPLNSKPGNQKYQPCYPLGVGRRDGRWHFRLRLYKPYRTNKHRMQRQNHFTPSNRVHWSIRTTNSRGREHSRRFVKNEQRSKRKVRNPKPFNPLPVTCHPNHACQYTPLKGGTPKRYQTSVTNDSRAPCQLPACRRLLFPLLRATKEIGDGCTQATCQWIRDNCGYIRRISTNSGTQNLRRPWTGLIGRSEQVTF